MQTRQQQDAKLAYKQVSQVSKEERKDYARAVYRFPILVRINGLQQTMGFYAGKAAGGGAGQGEKLFLQHLARVLNMGEGDSGLPKKIAELDLEQYLWYTRRCLEVSIWYRRFVESVLKVDVTGYSEDVDKSDKEEIHADTDAE